MSKSNQQADQDRFRTPFFYGWLILMVAVLAQIMTAPGQTVGVSEFKDLFGDKLKLTERSVALYYCYGTALGSFALPLFGFLIDRFGCRWSLMLVASLFGLTCLLGGYASSPFQLLLVFTFLRMLGQGALSLVASTMVSLWFRRRLALAYSIMSVGSGMGMMFVPYVFKPLFESAELVVAFQLISIGVFLLIPIGFFVVVDRPGLIGVSQDGDPLKHVPPKGDDATGSELDNDQPQNGDSQNNELQNGKSQNGKSQNGKSQNGKSQNSNSRNEVRDADGLIDPLDFTFGEAVRSRTFWIVTAVQSAWALIGTGLVFNRKSIFEALDSSEFITDLAVPGLFAAVIVSQIVTGLVARRFSHAAMFSAASLGVAAACGLILFKSPQVAFIGFVTFGLAQGILIIMGQSLWADFYGRSHIGKIRGLVWMLVVLSSSLGGFALTLGDDSATEFRPIEISLGVMAILSCLALFINRPSKPTSV